ncbi:MAG: hypothetical protein ABIG28_00810 [archaeon]
MIDRDKGIRTARLEDPNYFASSVGPIETVTYHSLVSLALQAARVLGRAEVAVIKYRQEKTDDKNAEALFNASALLNSVLYACDVLRSGSMVGWNDNAYENYQLLRGFLELPETDGTITKVRNTIEPIRETFVTLYEENRIPLEKSKGLEHFFHNLCGHCLEENREVA